MKKNVECTCGIHQISLVQTVKSPKRLSVKICPRDVLREIRLFWGGQPQGKVWLPKGPPMGNFFRQSMMTFHCLSDFGLQKPKQMRPRVAPWACLEKQWVVNCSSLTVLNPDFGGWRTKSVQKNFMRCLYSRYKKPCVFSIHLYTLGTEEGEAQWINSDANGT